MSDCTLGVVTAGVVDNRLRGKKLHGRDDAGNVPRAATKKRDDDTVDVHRLVGQSPCVQRIVFRSHTWPASCREIAAND